MQIINGWPISDRHAAAHRRAATLHKTCSLNIIQGPNHTGTTASAGTHDGDGAEDVTCTCGRWLDALRCMRLVGFAAWMRDLRDAAGKPIPRHIHGILKGCPSPSAPAVKQLAAYAHRLDGLAAGGPDPWPTLWSANTWETYMASLTPRVYYVVRAGDTLARIAARFRMSWRTLYARNRATVGRNPNKIKPGQRLRIR